MDCNEDDNIGALNSYAVNSTILDYYKKFGRQRDLEQYFSLSTAQGEIRDPTGAFWAKMKVNSDSSDSGGKRSDSSREVCRISIKCSVPDPSSSQDENIKSGSEPVSPPIVNEEFAVELPSRPTSRCTDEGSVKSADDNSQKSYDVLLDTSINKALSPSSSVTSQRKLEWDSLADVGYANESDRKTSASSLSTLERLALKQQYANNDTQHGLGPPTAHSTPLDDNQNITKNKGIGKKSTKTPKMDVELLELNMPHSSDNKISHAINLHLTKHISFSVDNTGELIVENVKKDIDVSPQKVPQSTENILQDKIDKEIQTSLINSKEYSTARHVDCTEKPHTLMSINTLKKKNRRRKFRLAQKKIKKKLPTKKENVIVQEKSGDQLSEAESFEYMPGHIYNQNHLQVNQSVPNKSTSNKSSLESSGAQTTDSSKGSKHSFTKDLEKSIDLLKAALQQRYDDNLKKKLVKEIIQRLLKSKYRDDDSTTDFLSGLSFGSKKLDIGHSTTTSTHTSGDSNDTIEMKKMTKPKKSILRMDKFNANAIASTSQSAPNIPIAACSDKPISSKLNKHLTSPNTDSDISAGEKCSSKSIFARTSSEELYRKYIDALRREEAYKKHLKDKELFLKQKLTNSDSAFKIPKKTDIKTNRIKHLMNDLIRNNYDDGSGDASKLEGGSDTNMNYCGSHIKSQRSHSVFTLSSCNSDSQSKKPNLKKHLQNEVKDLPKPGSSRENNHYCCCSNNLVYNKCPVTDSSVQVNIKDHFEPPKRQSVNSTKMKQCLTCDVESSQNIAQIFSDHITGDIKYVCLCSEKVVSQDVSDKFLVYKCSRLSTKGIQSEEITNGASNAKDDQANICLCKNIHTNSRTSSNKINLAEGNLNSEHGQLKTISKLSQTNLISNLLSRQLGDKSMASSTSDLNNDLNLINLTKAGSSSNKALVHEATRCIQTEISINPQISDPSLPDIHIINDIESVKLISEQVKEVAKFSSVDEITGEPKNYLYTHIKNVNDKESANSDVNLNYKKNLEKEIKRNNPAFVEIAENNIQLNLDDINNTEIITDNFTIPIQGTNMKLMVSIGSNENKTPGKSIVKSARATEAFLKNSDHMQDSTSTGEESCKSIQYHANIDSAHKTDNFDPELYINLNNDEVNNNKQMKDQSQQYNQTVREPFRFNTYPINVRKPVLRSNTNIENADAYTQTKFPDEINIAPQKLQAFDNIPPTYLKQPSENILDTERNNKKDTSLETLSKVSARDIETQSDYIQPNTSITTHNNPQRSKNSTSSKSVGSSTEFDNKVEIPKKANQMTKESQVLLDNQPKSSSEVDTDTANKSKTSTENDSKQLKAHIMERKTVNEVVSDSSTDPILDMIKDITRRYSKDDTEKHKRKKCFKEIVTVLNYLLDTDGSTDRDQSKPSRECTSEDNIECKPIHSVTKMSESCQTTNLVDKAIQISGKKSKNKVINIDSSDLPTSTDLPATSSDTATCKVLNKIKKECERYHQKRCKSHTGKKCDPSSSTSANCDQCKKIHHCSCRLHKCKSYKSKSNVDKAQKKSVAYNLIIQTSESMISEETTCGINRRPLQNIIVRVPSTRNVGCVPFRELESKIEKRMSHCSPRCDMKTQRSRSCPDGSEVSSADDYAKHSQECTVRDYLEVNRPDFIENCVQRQDCLNIINKSRANERAINRELLSAHVDRDSPLNALNIEELKQLAKDIGIDSTHKKRKPKFISERDMKRHSEKIYKSLPEVTRKKEEIRKENIKKTNLLMADIFKKNLQKKTLRGSVNLSNYSTIIKI